MPRKKKLQEVGGLRLVAYYRYSGGSGQTEQSIEGQRRDCEAYAKLHGMTIQHEYIDRHISGKTDDRVSFQQMIRDSDKGAFDMVICWKTDRFARNRYDSAVYKKRLRDNGVEIIYAAESNISGAEGIIIEGLMESLAEYYSAELADVRRRSKNLLDAIENGTANPHLTARLDELTERENTLRFQLSTLTDEKPLRFTKEEYLFLLEQFLIDPAERNEDYGRRVVHTFVTSMEVSDSKLLIYFNISEENADKNKNASPSELQKESSTVKRLVRVARIELTAS